MAVRVASPGLANHIHELNDAFRKSFVGGRVVMTRGVVALTNDDRAKVIQAVRTFDSFSDDDDPHGEHDFGAVEIRGERYFWKVDYYDQDLASASPDPTNLAVTTRILTIMRADEW